MTEIFGHQIVEEDPGLKDDADVRTAFPIDGDQGLCSELARISFPRAPPGLIVPVVPPP